MILKQQKKYLSSGFTLIEILVVVSVIVIISVISILSYNGIRKKQRDAQRITDVKKIALGLERYKMTYGDYPVCTSEEKTISGVSSFQICSNDLDWLDCLGNKLKPFIGEIPAHTEKDNPLFYCYQEVFLFDRENKQVSLVFHLEEFQPNLSGSGIIVGNKFFDPFSSTTYISHSILFQEYQK